MKRYLLLFLGFAVTSVSFYACKLDPAILPGDPGYVQQYPPGGSSTTGGGTTTGNTGIDTSLLAGNWTVKTTAAGTISNGTATNFVTSPVNLFTGVDIISTSKLGIFSGSFTLITTDSLTYTLSTANGKTNITFSQDPVGRSANGPIQITSLTSTTMTWVAPDPEVIVAQGQSIQAAYEFTFTK